VDFFTRILSFDLGLAGRSEDEVVIGIVYQERYRASFLVKDQLLAIGGGGELTAGGIPVRFVPLPVQGVRTLTRDMTRLGVNHLYVPPLRALDVGEIARTATAGGILTLTAVAEYMEEGVAVGLGTRVGRPEILINRETAEEAGARFSPELLNLARIVSTGGER